MTTPHYKTFPQLDPASALSDADLLAIWQVAAAKPNKATFAEVKAAVNAAFSTVLSNNMADISGSIVTVDDDDTGAGASAYAFASAREPITLPDGFFVCFRAHKNNDGSGTTMNIIGAGDVLLGRKDMIRADGSALAPLDIRAGGVYQASYNLSADKFYFINPAVLGNSSADTISFDPPSGSLITGTDVQEAIEDIEDAITPIAADVADLTALVSPPGSYTPSATAVANCGAVDPVPTVCRFTRIGNLVTVYGRVSIDPNAGNTVTRFRLTLPVASTFSANTDLHGVIAGAGPGAVGSGYCIADTSNHEAILSVYPNHASGQNYGFTFQYVVQ